MRFSLPATDEKAEYVLKQFDRIARGYDLTNDVISLGMHRLWKDTAIANLRVLPNGKYLDVCCGTGDLALRLAERLGPAAQVTGLDFSRNMLNIARMREANLKKKGERLCHLDWLCGDAQDLPFEDDTFHGAVISFGLRNLTDLQVGISEMARVVRPGGRVVNVDLGRPSGALFSPLFMFYFSQIVPMIGFLLQGDKSAYTYLPESMKTYPAPDGITKVFEAAGLKDVAHVPLASGSVALHCGIVS